MGYTKEEQAKRMRDWRHKNPDKAKAASRKWYWSNLEKSRQWARDFDRRGRERVINHYGSKCACCGESNPVFLSIDHKNNDGNIERRKFGAKLWKLVIKKGFPDTYQLLCYNCNMAKAIYGKCPHGGAN